MRKCVLLMLFVLCASPVWAASDDYIFFRRIAYGDRKDMADESFKDMGLFRYRGGRETGKGLSKYIGTGKYMLAKSQDRIDTWFYVSSEQAGTWEMVQGFDDYMAVAIDGRWVLVNKTYTKQVTATVGEVTEGWHALTVVYGDTYGGWGPNDYSAFPNEYPLGLHINGGGLTQFDDVQFTFGDPTAALAGATFAPLGSSAIYSFATMRPATGCRIQINPETTRYWLYEAPDLSAGCTFAFPEALKSRTTGQYLLLEWETGTPTLPADLDTLFDATSAHGAHPRVFTRSLGLRGGQLWVDLDYQTPHIVHRHLKFPATVTALTLDGGFQNMEYDAYVTSTDGYTDITCLHNSYTYGDDLWAESLLYHSQNRMDGWFYVTPDQAGVWKFTQGFDDFMAVGVDGAWVIVNETYLNQLTSEISLAAGWHSFTIVFGDTVGDFGPAGTAPWPYEYPIGVSIKGGTMVKFLAANVTLGNPLLDLSGDWHITTAGTTHFYALDVPAGARLVFDPSQTTLHSVSAPNFADGAKFALPAAYATRRTGRFLLMSWDAGTPNVSIANFDSSCVQALNATLSVENVASGGRLWLNLAPDESVITATWTGAAGDACDTPGNWICRNEAEGIVADALPEAGTRVNVSGSVQLQIPDTNHAFDCAEFILDGDVTLAGDSDWRGLDPAKIRARSLLSGETYQVLPSFDVPSGVYFGTGVLPNQDTHIVLDVGVTAASQYWFGCWNIGYNNGAYAVCNDSYGIYSGYGNQGGTSGSVVANGRHTVELDRNLVKVDGVTVRTYDANSFQVNYELTLFAQNRIGEYYTPSCVTPPTFYSCQIYQNDVLVRDLRPARRYSNDMLGLLDVVTQQFFVPYRGTPVSTDATAARTIDVRGHALRLRGPEISTSLTLTVTDTTSATPGELHFDLPDETTGYNTGIFLAGNLRLVKDGAGTFVPLVRNVTYAGGTEITDGTVRMARSTKDTDYSPEKFKDTFGLRGSAVTVRTNGVFDAEGNYDLGLYPFVLDGGTLASFGGTGMSSTSRNGLGTVTLASDARLASENDLLCTTGALQLAGHTLDWSAGGRCYLRLRDYPISNGTFRVARGATLETTPIFQTLGPLDAATATLDLDCLLEFKHDTTVRNLTTRYPAAWGWNGTNATVRVTGRFHPVSCCFPNVEMQHHATLDLSDRTDAWNVKSEDTVVRDNATFEYYTTWAENATVYLDVGTRVLHNHDYLIRWDAAHAPDKSVRFRLAPDCGRTGECVKTSSGVYLFSGFTIFFR